MAGQGGGKRRREISPPPYRWPVPGPILHVTNGDAVVPELAAAAGVEAADVLVWRDVLHDGPVPDGLEPDALAELRARHLTSRAWSHADDVEVSEA